MLVLASVSVHETSLANQHFYSTFLGRREGVCKKSTLCTLVKMLKIIDDLLHVTVYSKTFEEENFHVYSGKWLIIGEKFHGSMLDLYCQWSGQGWEKICN